MEQPIQIGLILNEDELPNLPSFCRIFHIRLEYPAALKRKDPPHFFITDLKNLGPVGLHVIKHLDLTFHSLREFDHYLHDEFHIKPDPHEWAKRFEELLQEDGYQPDFSKAGESTVSFPTKKK